MLSVLLEEYVDRFGENFPIMCMMEKDEDEIAVLIETALRNNEKYEAEFSENALY